MVPQLFVKADVTCLCKIPRCSARMEIFTFPRERSQSSKYTVLSCTNRVKPVNWLV